MTTNNIDYIDIDSVVVDVKILKGIHKHVTNAYQRKGNNGQHSPKECMGLLFGDVECGIAKILKYYVYSAKNKTRNWIDFNHSNKQRRVMKLEKQYQKLYLGLYHSHVPLIGNYRRRAPSKRDINDFQEDSKAFVDIICSIWETGEKEDSDDVLRLVDYYRKDYYIRIDTYAFTFSESEKSNYVKIPISRL